MSEYADEYFREEVQRKYGFDPGSMYGDDHPRKPKQAKPRRPKTPCPVCGKQVIGLDDHHRDVHAPQGEKP